MTQEHPITPPTELMNQWIMEATEPSYVPTQAARWGADQELEACCEWLAKNFWLDPRGKSITDLRAARRPKPPSLKELNLKHLDVMERDGHYLPEIISDLRRAIESLPS